MPRKPTPDIMTDILAGQSTAGAVHQIDLDLIDDNPWQPRQTYDPAALEELAGSIERNGLQQIPAGRRTPDGRVQLVFGHRRRRAYDLLRAKHPDHFGRMPVQLLDTSDEQMADRAWAENKDRENLTALEEAHALQSALDAFGWSQAELARRRGMSPATLSNKLSLLRLPAGIQGQIDQANISERQAAAIVAIFKLPADLRQRAENYYNSDVRPSAIVRDALAGASSDALRQRTTNMLKCFSNEIHQQPWYKLEFADHIPPFEAASCQSCPHALKRDSGVYCTGPQTCHDNKAHTYALDDLRDAAAAIGLPAAGLLPSADRTDLDAYGGRETLKRLQDGDGCPHGLLQLRWLPDDYRRSGRRPYPAYPQAEPTCHHGTGKKCKCILADQRAKSSQGDGKTTDSAKRLIFSRAVPILAAALLEIDEPLLRHILARAVRNSLNGRGWSHQELAENVAEHILRNEVADWQTVNENKHAVTTMFTNAGLPDPFSLASQIDPAADATLTFPVL